MRIAIVGQQDFSYDVTFAARKLVFTESHAAWRPEMKIAIVGQQDFSYDVTFAARKLVFTESLLHGGRQ